MAQGQLQQMNLEQTQLENRKLQQSFDDDQVLRSAWRDVGQDIEKLPGAIAGKVSGQTMLNVNKAITEHKEKMATLSDKQLTNLKNQNDLIRQEGQGLLSLKPEERPAAYLISRKRLLDAGIPENMMPPQYDERFVLGGINRAMQSTPFLKKEQDRREELLKIVPDNAEAWPAWYASLPAEYQAVISPKYSKAEFEHVRQIPAGAGRQATPLRPVRPGLVDAIIAQPGLFHELPDSDKAAVIPELHARGFTQFGKQAPSGLVDAIVANPSLWDDLSKTDKAKVIPELVKVGFQEFGSPLNESAITNITETRSGIGSIRSLRETLGNNQDLEGPIVGLLAKVPYAERARIMQAQIDVVRQRVGRALEHGVLRKEDEEKYKRILPTIEDTPRVAAGKADIVERELARDLQVYVETQKAAGRRTGGVEKEIEKTLGGDKKTPPPPQKLTDYVVNQPAPQAAPGNLTGPEPRVVPGAPAATTPKYRTGQAVSRNGETWIYIGPGKGDDWREQKNWKKFQGFEAK